MDIPLSALANQKSLSLCEQPAVRERLWAIAVRLERDPVYFGREDLLQEGLLRIWLAEKERPGQTLSWYLQNVEFHLRDLVKAGRCLDSGKRTLGRIELLWELDEMNEPWEAATGVKDDHDFMTQIYLGDMIKELHRSLNALENVIVDLSLEGRGLREIARKLHLDHATVIKRLRKIVTVAQKISRLSPLDE